METSRVHHGDPYEDHGTPIFQKLLTFEFMTKTMVVEQLPSTIGNQRLAPRNLLPIRLDLGHLNQDGHLSLSQ
ncbi:MAG: hypothetical protein GY696_20800 [Gammaproteobacteria bacterium]|nr:hypothetical protein [Gammaproteobacteria bacterium]